MSTKKSIPVGFILRLLGMCLALFIVFQIVKPRELWEKVSQISLWIFVVSLLINVVRQALIGWRWMLMNTESSGHSLGQYILFTLAALPVQLFVPGIVGMDVVRGALIGQNAEENKAQNLISVLSDRVIGLFSVILLGIGFALFAPQFPSRWKYIGFLGVLAFLFVVGIVASVSKWLQRLFLWIFGFLGGLGEKLANLLELWTGIVAFFRANPRRVVLALFACLLIHFSWFFIVYLLAQNLQLSLSFFIIATVTAISWVILAIPVSFMGLGVNELSFAYLLSFQGVSNANATALSLHQAAINIVFAVLCIPLWLFLSRKKHSDENVQKMAP